MTTVVTSIEFAKHALFDAYVHPDHDQGNNSKISRDNFVSVIKSFKKKDAPVFNELLELNMATKRMNCFLF